MMTHRPRRRPLALAALALLLGACATQFRDPTLSRSELRLEVVVLPLKVAEGVHDLVESADKQ